MSSVDKIKYNNEIYDIGGEKGDNYSLEEQRIGTWIDGKPLYRKGFSGTSNLLWSDIDISGLNFDHIHVNGALTHFVSPESSGNYIRTNNSNQLAQINSSLKIINVYLGRENSNAYYYIFIEYTKTTD